MPKRVRATRVISVQSVRRLTGEEFSIPDELYERYLKTGYISDVKALKGKAKPKAEEPVEDAEPAGDGPAAKALTDDDS